MIRVGTDFSGIGAPEQALIKLGIEHRSIFACDYDKYSKQSYLTNYNTDIFYDDITKRNQTQTPYVDLYVAGFPCQAFSSAGNRRGFDDTRGTLFFDLLKYLDAKRPKYFILENVKGLTNHEKGRTFGTILDCLSKTVNKQMFLPYMPKNLGYHIYHKILNTKDYGIPQNRERIFIVGFREDNHKFNFPSPFKLEKKLVDILEEEVDEKYYLSDKAVDKIKRHKIKRHKNKSLDKDISNTIQAGYYKMGGRDQQYIRTHSLYPRSSKTGKGGSGPMSKDDNTSYCIDTGNAQAIEYNKKIRKLTPLECLRLQGFPDEFYHKCKEEGLSDTQIYKQAGNSMTVDVMAYLIKEILKNEI